MMPYERQRRGSGQGVNRSRGVGLLEERLHLRRLLTVQFSRNTQTQRENESFGELCWLWNESKMESHLVSTNIPRNEIY